MSVPRNFRVHPDTRVPLPAAIIAWTVIAAGFGAWLFVLIAAIPS